MVQGVDGRTGVVVAPVAVNALNAAEAEDDTQSAETAAVGVFVSPKKSGA